MNKTRFPPDCIRAVLSYGYTTKILTKSLQKWNWMGITQELCFEAIFEEASLQNSLYNHLVQYHQTAKKIKPGMQGKTEEIRTDL